VAGGQGRGEPVTADTQRGQGGFNASGDEGPWASREGLRRVLDPVRPAIRVGGDPARARFPVADPEITLLDLNPKTLEYASRRLAPLRPRTVQSNALDQLSDTGVLTVIDP
jgi:hypothetical protein